jgi:hypothetical protein
MQIVHQLIVISLLAITMISHSFMIGHKAVIKRGFSIQAGKKLDGQDRISSLKVLEAAGWSVVQGRDAVTKVVADISTQTLTFP